MGLDSEGSSGTMAFAPKNKHSGWQTTSQKPVPSDCRETDLIGTIPIFFGLSCWVCHIRTDINNQNGVTVALPSKRTDWWSQICILFPTKNITHGDGSRAGEDNS